MQTSTQRSNELKLAYRRGNAFLAERRRLPNAKAILAQATGICTQRHRYAFGRDPVARTVAERLAKRFQSDTSAIKADVLFALAVDAIVQTCGKRSESTLFCGRLDRKQIESISRVHPDRQLVAINRARQRKNPFGESKGDVPAYDTLGWYEVVSRLARADGLIRTGTAAVQAAGHRLTNAEREKATAALAKIIIAAERLSVLLMDLHGTLPAGNVGMGLSRLADAKPTIKQHDRLPHQSLGPAAGLLAKNVRDLPRLIGEQPASADVIQCIDRYIGSIRANVELGRVWLPFDDSLRIVRKGRLTFLGTESLGGTYVLRLLVRERLRLAFGRFKGGKLITVPPGEYLYVGSALSCKGATCLARRLARHATRTGRKAPQLIRAAMQREFLSVGLCHEDPLPKDGKNLKWNIDHLVDRSAVELTGALVIRSPQRIEGQVGRLLESDPHTSVIEPGLGANDIRGDTHLLKLAAANGWWKSLPYRIFGLLDDRDSTAQIMHTQHNLAAFPGRDS